MDKKDLRVLAKGQAYSGYFRIIRYRLQHRLFAGGWSSELEREVFDRGNAAAVLLYDPDLEAVVLIEQFRSGAINSENSPWLLELVAGVIEDGEDATAVARREAKEEAGLIIADLLPICHYWVSPGGCSEQVSLFCGKVDASSAGGIHGLQDEDEDIRVRAMPLAQAILALEEGKLNNGSTIIALQWLQLNKEKVYMSWLS